MGELNMDIYVVKYNKYVNNQLMYSSISSEAYKSLKEAQDFIKSRYGFFRKYDDFNYIGTDESYTISCVTIKNY